MEYNKVKISGLNYQEIEIVDIETSFNETMDIEVEKDHYYTLSNGIVSHNTVSLMTQTTSGIEPVFMPVYNRRRKVNPNDKNVKATFVDEVGDSWEEYNVFHPKFKVWSEINGYDVNELEKMSSVDLQKVVDKSPYYQATANDVDWVEKVRMQGAVNQYIDHSISVTVNLPQTATEEIVSAVYKMGWESGCKGITVYRDGSRSGVLVAKTDAPPTVKKEEVFIENHAPKRPKKLKCDVIRFTNNGEKWIGFLGVLNNRPFEIFTGLQDSVSIPSYIDFGEIRKTKVRDEESQYDFVYIDKDGYQQEFRGLSRAFNREYWNVGRLLSGILRHGMPLPSVLSLIDKLNFGDSSSITSWENGIKRMIKKYIKEGTKAHGESCPTCNSTHVVYVEGCKTCTDCGWSKCS